MASMGQQLGLFINIMSQYGPLIPQRISFLTILFIILLSAAAQCQAATPAPFSPPATPSPTPTVRLWPPIEPGDGSDLIDKLLERGIIRVGIWVWPAAEFSPPAFRGFSNAATGGALNGPEVDVARLIAQGLGLELELVEAYPPVINGGEWQGVWDIALASLPPLDQAPPNMAYSQPYAYMPMGLLLPATAPDIGSVRQLSGRTVGVLEHSVYQRLLNEPTLTIQGQLLVENLPATIEPLPLSNLPKAIQELAPLTGTKTITAELIFGPAPVFQQAIGSDLPLKLARPAELQAGQPLVVATVPQDNLSTDRLISEIDKILERLHRQGTLAEVYLQWYGQDISRPVQKNDD